MSIRFSQKKVFVLLPMAALLLALPGCLDWFGGGDKKPAPMAKKSPARDMAMPGADQAAPAKGMAKAEAPVGEDGSKVLITLAGKPLVTEQSLQEEIERLAGSSPELKEAMAFMGPQIKHMIADQLILRAVIGRYIDERGIDKQDDYRKSLECVMAHARDSVNQQFFVKDIKASASEREVRNYYDKERERFLVSQGGRKTKGVQFDSDALAKAFLRKVKSAGNDIVKAAQGEDGLAEKVRDFGLVHEDKIGIDPTLRAKILEVRSGSIPGAEVIEVDENTYWVVSISGQEEKKYRTYDEVKEQLKRILDEQAVAEASAKKLDSLKEKYGIEDFRETPQEPGLDLPMGDEELPELSDETLPAA